MSPCRSRYFSGPERGDLGYSSRFETVVALFAKALQFMNFPKSLSASFIGSKAALELLSWHLGSNGPTCSPLIRLVSYGILNLMVEELKCLLVSVIGYPEECSGQS